MDKILFLSSFFPLLMPISLLSSLFLLSCPLDVFFCIYIYLLYALCSVIINSNEIDVMCVPEVEAGNNREESAEGKRVPGLKEDKIQ